MSQVFVVIGAVFLVFCSIYGYLWLEVLRDPKNELQSFYSQHPRLHRILTIINKAWLLFVFLGACFIAVSIFVPPGLL